MRSVDMEIACGEEPYSLCFGGTLRKAGTCSGIEKSQQISDSYIYVCFFFSCCKIL